MKFDIPARRLHVVDFEIVEFRDARSDGGTFTIVGHAAVFDRLSEDLGGFREQIVRGAFRKSLDNQDDVRLLKNHDQNYVLARTKASTLELSEDPRGLRVYATVGDYSYARDVKIALERRDMDQMSFAFSEPVAEERWDYETNDNGEVSNVVRTITKFDRLYDVSVVTFPAYPQTDVGTHSLRSVTVGFSDNPVESVVAPDVPDAPDAPDTPDDSATADETDHESRRGTDADYRERVRAAKRRLTLVSARTNLLNSTLRSL